MDNIGNVPKVLGLDISTKTIGWALFNIQTEELLELTHFSPKIKPKPEDKIEEMLVKADQFRNKLIDYKDIGITKIIIEEPLINSNNIRTVAVLLRYNSFITRIIYDVLGLIPEYISTLFQPYSQKTLKVKKYYLVGTRLGVIKNILFGKKFQVKNHTLHGLTLETIL